MISIAQAIVLATGIAGIVVTAIFVSDAAIVAAVAAAILTVVGYAVSRMLPPGGAK